MATDETPITSLDEVTQQAAWEVAIGAERAAWDAVKAACDVEKAALSAAGAAGAATFGPAVEALDNATSTLSDARKAYKEAETTTAMIASLELDDALDAEYVAVDSLKTASYWAREWAREAARLYAASPTTQLKEAMYAAINLLRAYEAADANATDADDRRRHDQR